MTGHFRILWRQFLFRLADVESLSQHAQGDSQRLIGQLAALMIFTSVVLAMVSGGLSAAARTPQQWLAMTMLFEHFLIATTMLVVGLLAVLCWDQTFPDKRDVMLFAPLPVPRRTLFLAKVAAIGAALALTVALLHSIASVAWAGAFAANAAPGRFPSLAFDPPLAPVEAASFPALMDHDLQQALSGGPLAPGSQAGLVVAMTRGGARSLRAYGAARPDSIFEIGSVSKTFTATLLARMTVEGQVRLDEPVRQLLPDGLTIRPAGPEITLLDLATHHSGLPVRPPGGANTPDELFRAIARLGVARPGSPPYAYSNFAVALLGQLLARRAGVTYSELLAEKIARPLGLADTYVWPTEGQSSRAIQGYGQNGPVPGWPNEAWAPAGRINSTAADLLTWLEAQLDPGPSTLGTAIRLSQQLRADGAPGMRIGLVWNYRPTLDTYLHNGVTPGFTSCIFFCPRDRYAGVVLLNQWAAADMLGEHLRQRLAGEPAISLATVEVPAAAGLRGFFRWFGAYWVVMYAAGLFLFGSVLALQGIAAQLLPHTWFLRASGWMQMACFCLFVSVYFLQPPFPGFDELLTPAGRAHLAWLPSYWFLGLFHQLNGSPHPALANLARRAWTGLAIVLVTAAAAYLLAYTRTLKRIVESSDIPPAVGGGAWWPRPGAPLTTALFQFAGRTLLRSRRHRIVLAFYLGVALALTILFSHGAARQLDQRVPAFAATIVLMGFWILGARVVFALPIELTANWIFRIAPIEGGPHLARARRTAFLLLSVAPAWCLAVVVLWNWSVRISAWHFVILALLELLFARVCLRGPLKIPFACSYLPGNTNINVTFWLTTGAIYSVILKSAQWEANALEQKFTIPLVVAALTAAAAIAYILPHRDHDLRFEEKFDDAVQTLELELPPGTDSADLMCREKRKTASDPPPDLRG